MSASSKKVDFTEGPIFFKVFRFAAPIMLSGILQNAYHIADKVVVGSFSGDDLALAAVGSSGAITTFIVNLLISLSGGCGVVIAQEKGRGDRDAIERIIHTSMTFAAISGVIMMLLGILVTEPSLAMLGTKEELMGRAVVYMRISCVGIPANAIYNFAAAAFRALGDARTSLRILTFSGLLNVVLNVVFVVLFGMASEGVALATVISKYVSAVWIVALMLSRKQEPYALIPKRMRIGGAELVRILRFGIPMTIQGSMFSISNVILSSSVNSLPITDISAKTIAFSITDIINTSMSAFTHTAVTASAQNYGAGKNFRINRSLGICILQSAIIAFGMATFIFLFEDSLIGMFIGVDDPEFLVVRESAKRILLTTAPFYFIVGIMNSFSGTLRGMGWTVPPMVVSIVGICLLRVVWVNTIFKIPAFNNAVGLYMVYPITWLITSSILAAAFLLARSRMDKEEKLHAEKSMV